MNEVERLTLIKRIQDLRGSRVICYLTSLRPNVPGVMAEDQVRAFFEHLLLLPSRPVEKLDIFLVSNGGNSIVPWRLVALFREFAKRFSVLVPYRAYSAATLLALGADEIVMHPFAELGPIDPTVSNEFNPTEQGSGQRIGINVEDVKAYVNFIKSTVGIQHEDELIEAIKVLCEKVHPLALGNVERFLSQSRMVAKKILGTHMGDNASHAIEEIVENMASKLYFHGHPINRKEAKDDLNLKVLPDLAPSLESAIWDLYKEYEAEFKNTDPFNPLALLAGGISGPSQESITVELLHVIIESERMSSRHTTTHRLTSLQVPMQPGQQLIRDEVLSQEWNHSKVQVEKPQVQPL